MKGKITPQINLTKHCILPILLLLLVSPLILADTIGETTITIKIYNNTLEIINSDFSGNDRTETFEILNSTNSLVISDHLVKYKEFSFSFIFIKNESVSMDVVSQYVACLDGKSTCLEEKASYNTAWTACLLDLNEYEGENATTTKDALNNCNLSLQSKDITIGSLQSTISDNQIEKDETENLKWIYGVVAAAIAVVATLLFTGKIGKGGGKDKSEDEFNKNLQG